MGAKKTKGLTRREFMATSGKGIAGAAVGTGIFSLLKGTAYAAKSNIIHATNQEAVVLNPLLYNNIGPENVPEACLFDALWDVNDMGDFVPNLAVKVPTKENGGISEDGLTWKIELRKDVKWHDGHPFSVKDFEFTYQTLNNPEIPVRSRAGMDLIEKFTVIDDNNVEIKLSKPFAPFIWVWQIMHLVPEHILSKVSDFTQNEFNEKPIGTGPFLIKKRVPGSHIEYEKNVNYHRPVSNLKIFIHKYVPTKMGLLTQLKTGEIDITTSSLPPERYAEAQKLSNLKFILSTGNGVEFIYFNCGKPQFKDPRVRRALYMAVDKEKWIKDIYYGLNARTLSYLSPDHWAYNTDLKDPGYNPVGAAELLDAAGWKVGNRGIREKDGVKLEFTMSTTAGAAAREQAQALIQQNWKEINVAMEIKNFPGSVVWGKYTTDSEFDTLMVGWQLTLGMDPDYTNRLHSKQIPRKHGQGANYVQYENPEVDQLLEKGATTMNREKRKAAYWRIQEILHEEVPFAPIFDWSDFIGMNAKLKGYKDNVYTPDKTWNVQEWEWS